MPQDWTNQPRYAIDDSPIQNPLFQRSCLLKLRKYNKKQPIKLSLTQRRKTAPTNVYSNSNSIPEIDFFYADIHSNLKFRLKNAINNNLSNKRELLILFENFGWDLVNLDGDMVSG